MSSEVDGKVVGCSLGKMGEHVGAKNKFFLRNDGGDDGKRVSALTSGRGGDGGEVRL
jgi:hypothetical protein